MYNTIFLKFLLYKYSQKFEKNITLFWLFLIYYRIAICLIFIYFEYNNNIYQISSFFFDISSIFQSKTYCAGIKKTYENEMDFTNNLNMDTHNNKTINYILKFKTPYLKLTNKNTFLIKRFISENNLTFADIVILSSKCSNIIENINILNNNFCINTKTLINSNYLSHEVLIYNKNLKKIIINSFCSNKLNFSEKFVILEHVKSSIVFSKKYNLDERTLSIIKKDILNIQKTQKILINSNKIFVNFIKINKYK